MNKHIFIRIIFVFVLALCLISGAKVPSQSVNAQRGGNTGGGDTKVIPSGGGDTEVDPGDGGGDTEVDPGDGGGDT